jgi:glyoxylase-like metal-dependent hydrolase (beta-lactamase superfamily II)
MLQIQTFIGGIFDTNAYLLRGAQGNILFDAPTGSAEWIRSLGVKPDILLITHGHVDHIDDAAKIKRLFGPQVAYHRDSLPMITDADFFRNFGFYLEAEPVQPDFFVEETDEVVFCGVKFRVLLVPGHCPGSVCFHSQANHFLIGGDVLFAGGIGRTDLPGGDHALLIKGIREKLLLLPDETKVLPGHGPITSIGEERRMNPFLRPEDPLSTRLK